MNFTDRTWKTERKWTGNHKLFTDAGMVADYYYPLVKSAQNTNKRWLEWFIVENYKYSKKSWDAVQPYIPIYEKEIKYINDYKNDNLVCILTNQSNVKIIKL